MTYARMQDFGKASSYLDKLVCCELSRLCCLVAKAVTPCLGFTWNPRSAAVLDEGNKHTVVVVCCAVPVLCCSTRGVLLCCRLLRALMMSRHCGCWGSRGC